MITLIRGAQRYLSFTAGTNGYAQCSQIVVRLEHVNSGEVAKEWRKVAHGFGRVVVSNVLDYIETNIKNGEFQTNIAKQTEYLKGLPSSLQYEAMYQNTPVSKKMIEEKFNIVSKEYADNAAAIAGGLTTGDYYHTAGVIKIVI